MRIFQLRRFYALLFFPVFLHITYAKPPKVDLEDDSYGIFRTVESQKVKRAQIMNDFLGKGPLMSITRDTSFMNLVFCMAWYGMLVN